MNSRKPWRLFILIAGVLAGAASDLLGAPPSLTLSLQAVDGLTITVNGLVLPGEDGKMIERLSWKWGDGTIEDHWFPATHTYPRAGGYDFTVTAFQSDGLTTSKTMGVGLTPVSPSGKLFATGEKVVITILEETAGYTSRRCGYGSEQRDRL